MHQRLAGCPHVRRDAEPFVEPVEVTGRRHIRSVKRADAVYLDVALLVALLAFLGTVAFAAYAEEGGPR